MRGYVKKYCTGLLFRYFVSYLLIFLVPFVILVGALYHSTVLSQEKQLEASNVNNLRQTDTLISERFSELDKMAEQVKLNPKLTNYMLKHPYYNIESRTELGNIQSNSSFISEMFLYYNTDELFYSHNGTYTKEALVENRFRDKGLTLKALDNNLKLKLPTLTLSPSREGSRGMVQYYVPLFSGGIQNGSAFFLINKQELQKVLNNTTADYEGVAYLVDKENRVVVSSAESKEVFVENGEITPLLRGGSRINIEGMDYTVSSLKMGVEGFRLVTILETEQFMYPLKAAKKLFGIVSVIIFSVGLVMSYIMSLKQYQPIKKIDAAFQKIASKEEPLDDHGEWLSLENRVNNFVQEHQSMNKALDEKQSYVRGYFLTKLLEGKYKTTDILNDKMDELSVEMAGSNYFVMLLGTQDEIAEKDKVKQRTVLLEHFPMEIGSARIDAVEMPDRDQLVLVVTDEKVITNHRQYVLSLQRVLNQELYTKTVLDIGECYSELIYLNRSYIEAISAYNAHRESRKEDLFFFKNIIYSAPKFFSIPNALKSKLKQGIAEGDEVVSMETVKTIFSNSELRSMTSNEKKYYYFDTIKAVIDSIDQLEKEDLLSSFQTIVEYDTPDALEKELLELVNQVCQEVNRAKEEKTNKLESDIIIYINDNYRSHDLSLENMALIFNFSISYLSRFVKEQTGVTFSRYVQELRLEEIKRRLVETDDTIKEIVVQTGYYDVSNYTRKFKSIVGVTPGQYRSEYKK